jgi:hypothetical protein
MDQTEELQLIEKYYRQTVSWAPSDEEALAIAQDLLEKAQRGFVVDDTGDGLIYAADPDLPVDAEFLVDEGALRQQRLRRGLAIVAAFLVAFVALLLVYGGDPGPTAPGAPAATTRAPIFIATQTLTPLPTRPVTLGPTLTLTATPSGAPSGAPSSTPSPAPTLTPTQSPTPLPPEEVDVKPQPVKLEEGAVVPVSLEIAGRYFPVVPTSLRDDNWAYMTEPDQACAEQSECISWLAGSYVNIVLGLPYTEQNLDLMAATLAISDTLVLRNNVASVNRYIVVERRHVDVYAIEAFRQRRAGLTLVLLGGIDEPSAGGPDRRLVVWAVPTEPREEVTQP